MTQAKAQPSVGSYKYDAALSFAGEDRKHAESLYRLLTRRGFSVFYDIGRQGDLWGKSAKGFEPVYGRQTRYVIPFVSKHYVAKDWTRYEFETAKREQMRRRREFILPVRLDDSRLLGLHDDIVHLDARDTTISQIAKFFAGKCRPRRPHTTQHGERRVQTLTAGLLGPSARHTLAFTAVRINRHQHAGLASSGAFGRVGGRGPDEVAGCCCPDYARANSPWVARSTVGGPSNG